MYRRDYVNVYSVIMARILDLWEPEWWWWWWWWCDDFDWWVCGQALGFLNSCELVDAEMLEGVLGAGLGGGCPSTPNRFVTSWSARRCLTSSNFPNLRSICCLSLSFDFGFTYTWKSVQQWISMQMLFSDRTPQSLLQAWKLTRTISPNSGPELITSWDARWSASKVICARASLSLSRSRSRSKLWNRKFYILNEYIIHQIRST